MLNPSAALNTRSHLNVILLHHTLKHTYSYGWIVLLLKVFKSFKLSDIGIMFCNHYYYYIVILLCYFATYVY